MFTTKYRRGVFDTKMLNLCEQLMAQVCTDFGATLAEFTENEAMSTHSRSTPESGALPPRQLPQRRLIQAVAAGFHRQDQQGCDKRQVLGPSPFARSCGSAPLSTVQEYIIKQKRPE